MEKELKANFQDMELLHKNQEVVSGDPVGEDASRLKEPMQHMNAADSAMTRLLEKNGKN